MAPPIENGPVSKQTFIETNAAHLAEIHAMRTQLAAAEAEVAKLRSEGDVFRSLCNTSQACSACGTHQKQVCAKALAPNIPPPAAFTTHTPAPCEITGNLARSNFDDASTGTSCTTGDEQELTPAPVQQTDCQNAEVIALTEMGPEVRTVVDNVAETVSTVEAADVDEHSIRWP